MLVSPEKTDIIPSYHHTTQHLLNLAQLLIPPSSSVISLIFTIPLFRKACYTMNSSHPLPTHLRARSALSFKPSLDTPSDVVEY